MKQARRWRPSAALSNVICLTVNVVCAFALHAANKDSAIAIAEIGLAFALFPNVHCPKSPAHTGLGPMLVDRRIPDPSWRRHVFQPLLGQDLVVAKARRIGAGRGNCALWTFQAYFRIASV